MHLRGMRALGKTNLTFFENEETDPLMGAKFITEYVFDILSRFLRIWLQSFYKVYYDLEKHFINLKKIPKSGITC
jgi:hypothetical protein